MGINEPYDKEVRISLSQWASCVTVCRKADENQFSETKELSSGERRLKHMKMGHTQQVPFITVTKDHSKPH